MSVRMSALVSCLLVASWMTSLTAEEISAWRGTLKSDCQLSGKIVPAEGAEISLDLNAYSGDLRITSVASHGTFVNEGDLLLHLDTKTIDEQIRKAEFNLNEAQSSYDRAEALAHLDHEARLASVRRAEQKAEWAQRQLDGYLQKELQFKKESVRLQNQGGQHSLDDQRDELSELQKMYREDELVDSTEEIVLKRARRRLASSTARVELSEAQRDYDLRVVEVLKEERLRAEAKSARESLERERRRTVIQEQASESSLARQSFELEQKRETLALLRRDREAFTVRAPRSGLVLHSSLDALPQASLLKNGGRIAAGQVLLTVASVDSLEVKTQLPEAELYRVGSGDAAHITFEALPTLSVVGRLSVSYMPTISSNGNVYETTARLSQSDPRLRVGMSCQVTIPIEARDAVLLPIDAVSKKDGDPQVLCRDQGGVFKARKVVTGLSDAEHIVIVKGVAEGDVIRIEDKQ